MSACRKCGAERERLSSGRLACKPCKAAYDKERRADPALAELDRQRSLAWAAANRDVASARSREWHASNRDRAAAVKRAKYQKDRLLELEKRRQHYLANAEAYKRRARESTWRQDNPAGAAALSHRRRALKRAAVCEHGDRCVDATFLRDLYASACVYCGAPAEHADHFQPIARGGLHCRENVVPACALCNTSKAAADPFVWLAERRLLA